MLLADTVLVDGLAPSPNFGARRAPLDSIILHYTGMETAEGALAWLRNPASEVSCHYFIDEDGQITQMVAESARAWHAGTSNWRGQDDLNSRSIGIEIVNQGAIAHFPPYPPQQIASVIKLCRDIIQRHGLRPEAILAHSDVAPARKQDPGENFPWHELHAHGVGLWVPAEPFVEGPVLEDGHSGSAVLELQQALIRYGYGLEASGQFDAATRAVVTAFQRHFRQARVDGRADVSTILTLQALLGALACA
ncbi:MAG: N-acetylmuramoyl-L-alanine amidase [Hyphomicrobiales bacterium]|nr:N-acetylmuramoyl-L-alanine amidase [Hyphomicrobiales bacterium]